MISSFWTNEQGNCWHAESHWHYIGDSERFPSLPETQKLECSQKCSNSIPENIVALQMANSNTLGKNRNRRKTD